MTKLQGSFLRAIAAAALAAGTLLGAGAHAATGGGATIHNAATLTYNSGQQVTDWVNVEVMTIGTAPEIDLTSSGPFDVNAGDTITLNYTITANANGTDNYSLSAATSGTTGLTPGTTFTVSANTVTLGASITTAPSVVVDGDTGTLFIPSGSESNLSVGDIVVVGGFAYLLEDVRTGVIASTTGNTTTAETYTEIDLTVLPASGAPPIGNGTIAAGQQIGERQTFTVDVTVSAPTTVGTDGEVNVVITGNTSALDTGGNPVPYDTSTDGDGTNDPVINVLSATVTILKEARNVTKGGVFAASGVSAQTGDVLEYRITMTATAGNGDAVNSVLVDELPQYTAYNTGSTTLNGNPVADDAGPASAFPLDSAASTGNGADNGVAVNSATGAAGEIVDSESAVVIYAVTVQ
ncbi:MAG: hypothetical protein ACOY3X_07595 [Pseudomonadota bacterium]